MFPCLANHCTRSCWSCTPLRTHPPLDRFVRILVMSFKTMHCLHDALRTSRRSRQGRRFDGAARTHLDLIVAPVASSHGVMATATTSHIKQFYKAVTVIRFSRMSSLMHATSASSPLPVPLEIPELHSFSTFTNTNKVLLSCRRPNQRVRPWTSVVCILSLIGRWPKTLSSLIPLELPRQCLAFSVCLSVRVSCAGLRGVTRRCAALRGVAWRRLFVSVAVCVLCLVLRSSGSSVVPAIFHSVSRHV